MTKEQQLVQGPLPEWKLTAEQLEKIDEMLSSDNELVRAYGEVYREGFFVTEFRGIAAVGEAERINELEFRLGEEINPLELSIGDCIALGALPGGGETRADAVRDALKNALEHRERSKDPEELDLFGSFTQNGYKVRVLMPRNSNQPTQWTIRIYREGEEDLIQEIIHPMSHAPIFGVNLEDRASLDRKVEMIIQELVD